MTLTTILGTALSLLLIATLLRVWPAPAHSETATGQPRSASAPVNGLAASRPDVVTATATRPSAWSAGDLIDALRERLETAGRNDVDLRQSAALLALQQGRYEAALSAFDRLLLKRPNDAAILLGKALALTGLGRHDDALPLFQNLTRMEPDSIPTWYGYGVALMRCEEQKEAAGILSDVLRKEPSHAQALFNLAILRQSDGRRIQALEAWRRLTGPVGSDPGTVATRPESGDANSSKLTPAMLADAWFHRGEMAMETNHLQEAEACFLNAANLSPAEATAWCNVGIVRVRQFRRDDAAAALEKALERDARLVPALNQLAYLYAADLRDTGTASYGDRVIELCDRSLAVRADQPNIRELRTAIRSSETEVAPEAEPQEEP